MLTCCGWTPDPEFTVVPSFAFIIPVTLGTTIFRRVIEIGSCDHYDVTLAHCGL